jgi:hypothetical protein
MTSLFVSSFLIKPFVRRTEELVQFLTEDDEPDLYRILCHRFHQVQFRNHEAPHAQHSQRRWTLKPLVNAPVIVTGVFASSLFDVRKPLCGYKTPLEAISLSPSASSSRAGQD